MNVKTLSRVTLLVVIALKKQHILRKVTLVYRSHAKSTSNDMIALGRAQNKNLTEKVIFVIKMMDKYDQEFCLIMSQKSLSAYKSVLCILSSPVNLL